MNTRGTIYVESDGSGMPANFDMACAYYGAVNEGSKVKLVTREELGAFRALWRTNLFVGTIPFMQDILGSDRTMPPPLDRAHELTTLSTVLARYEADGVPFFVKPEHIKVFDGWLVLEAWHARYLVGFDGSTPVYVDYDLKEVLSEHRFYVVDGKISDVRCYSGDYRLAPDFGYVDSIVERTDMRHYTVDVGVTASETFHIEYNDFWSVGNYGMPNDMYLRGLRQRYFEMMCGQ